MQKTLIDGTKFDVDYPQLLIVHFYKSNVYKNCIGLFKDAEWSCTSTPSIHPHAMLGDKFIFNLLTKQRLPELFKYGN
jgi:hypothetical protein